MVALFVMNSLIEVCVCLNIKYMSVGVPIFLSSNNHWILSLHCDSHSLILCGVNAWVTTCAFQVSRFFRFSRKISYVWFHSRLRHCFAANYYVDLYRNVYGSWLASRVNKLLISILDFIKRRSLRIIAPVFNGEAYRPRSFLTVLSISYAFDH